MIKFEPFLDHLKSQKKMLMFQTDVFLQSRMSKNELDRTRGLKVTK